MVWTSIALSQQFRADHSAGLCLTTVRCKRHHVQTIAIKIQERLLCCLLDSDLPVMGTTPRTRTHSRLRYYDRRLRTLLWKTRLHTSAVDIVLSTTTKV